MKEFLLCAGVVSIMALAACTNTAKVETTVATTEAAKEETKVVETTKAETKTEKNESVNHYTEREFSWTDDMKFEYNGTDKYLKAITDEMVKVGNEHFGKQGAVEIPSPLIVKTDDSDKNDIKVYGDFTIDGYIMNGTIFDMKNGGSFPGCYHLKDENGNVTFVKSEIAEDGSDNYSSLVKICGGDENLTKEIFAAKDKDKDETRVKFAKMYAKEHNLRLSGIKDYGWPVILFDDIDDAVFVYNFFDQYYKEINQEDTLNDMVERIERLKEKYFTKELQEKISQLTMDAGADMVINAQDVTPEMRDSLQTTNDGKDNVKLTVDLGDKKATAHVKLAMIDGKKKITDISYEQ